jgi:cytochrome c553
MTVLSVLFLTPEIRMAYWVRQLMGQEVLVNGVAIDWLLEAFDEFAKDVLTQDPALMCTLCPAELRKLREVGCVIGLYDPQIVDEEQNTIWCAACVRCHDKDPATVQRRMLERYAEYSGGGQIVDIGREHPTPQ